MKKGFVFTAVVILALLIIVLAVSYYTQTLNERERRAEEKFRYIATSQILDMVSEHEISNFAEMSAFYALHNLTEFIIYKNEPLKQGSGPTNNKYTEYVNKSIYSLMAEGNVPSDNFNNPSASFAYSPDEKKYTFKEWGEKINSICGQLGYTCNITDIRNFSFYQSSPWDVTVYFNATTYVESNDGRFKREQDITVNRTFSIEGFSDPMVSRLMINEGSDEEARRQIFRYKGIENPTVDNITITKISDADRGKGFFYGPILKLSNIKYEPSHGVTDYYSDAKSGKYILKDTFFEWNSLTETQRTTLLNAYGAFIVEQASSDECIEQSETGSWSAEQTFTVTVCRGKPGETTRDITVQCRATCNYQECTADNCLFDCYEGLTDCEWENSIKVPPGGSIELPTDCDGVPGLPFDFEGGDPYLEFRTHSDYASQRATLCNHASIEASIPGLGTGTYTNEIEKPYLFYSRSSGISVSRPGNYPVEDDFYGSLSNRQFILINNENAHDASAEEAFSGFHELWNLNDFRELIMCGQYLETNESGPSFFQRMLYKGERLNSVDFGLETFVVGKYAGGFFNPDKDNYCQLDRNFINEVPHTELIKGMPGCNSFEMTSTFGFASIEDNPVTYVGTGHFGLDEDVIERYGLGDIVCSRGARCE